MIELIPIDFVAAANVLDDLSAFAALMNLCDNFKIDGNKLTGQSYREPLPSHMQLMYFFLFSVEKRKVNKLMKLLAVEFRKI